MNFSLCSSAEQAAAYAGLAPIPRESGTSIRKHYCIGHTGSERLQTALYLVTLSAARYNPVIKRFYDRLRAVANQRRWGARQLHANCCTSPLRLLPTRRILIRSICEKDNDKQPPRNRIESIIGMAKHIFCQQSGVSSSDYASRYVGLTIQLRHGTRMHA